MNSLMSIFDRGKFSDLNPDEYWTEGSKRCRKTPQGINTGPLSPFIRGPTASDEPLLNRHSKHSFNCGEEPILLE